MASKQRQSIERRVVRTAEAALADKHYVTPIDVLVGVGWLPAHVVDTWRQGRVDYLEAVTTAGLGKISTAMRFFRHWAQQRGLTPSETAYIARTRDRRPLRFSKSGDPGIEQAYPDALGLPGPVKGEARATRRAGEPAAGPRRDLRAVRVDVRGVRWHG
jgi:hypothetical protein